MPRSPKFGMHQIFLSGLTSEYWYETIQYNDKRFLKKLSLLQTHQKNFRKKKGF